MAASTAELLQQFAPPYSTYEDIYKHVHEFAELSWQEHETAALAERTLRSISSDIAVTTGVGGTTGLFGVLRNGPGATVLLRADMDALPVREDTGLAYACRKEAVDAATGTRQPVMHACGHDMHVAALLAAADVLAASRTHWSGTAVFLFQPAEEKLGGAKAMVRGGLYVPAGEPVAAMADTDEDGDDGDLVALVGGPSLAEARARTGAGCPRPDVVLGQHVFNLRAGTVALRAGLAMAGVDGLVVRVYGHSAHGSMPHLGVDAALLASHVVVHLQSIVSRGVAPGDLAVVTVGALHAGGSADNIVADAAELRINLRSSRPAVRAFLRERVPRIVRGLCVAAGSPREPDITPVLSAPPLHNDEAVAARVAACFCGLFGARYATLPSAVPASEDFGILATAAGAPLCFWAVGSRDAADYDVRAATGTLASIPVNHRADYAPAIQPTLRTGVESLVAAAWVFLRPEDATATE